MAASGSPPHIEPMSLRSIALIAVLAVLLAGALVVSLGMWNSIDGGAGMNGNGIAALVIGGIGTLALGGGLMALMFFSSRRGYDDAADLKSRRPEDR